MVIHLYNEWILVLRIISVREIRDLKIRDSQKIEQNKFFVLVKSGFTLATDDVIVKGEDDVIRMTFLTNKSFA